MTINKTRNWSTEAEAAIGKAPFFVRPMARRRAEQVASSHGRSCVALEDVEEARSLFLSSRQARPQNPRPIAEKDAAREIEALVERASNVKGHQTRHYDIRVCGGAVGCPFALVDVQALADALCSSVEKSGWGQLLEERVKGPILAHHKFRAAVAGCPNACSEPQIRDFGVIGQMQPGRGEAGCTQCLACIDACREDAISADADGPHIDRAQCVRCGLCVQACDTGALVAEVTGYRVTVGGKLGRHPRLAETLTELADEGGVQRAAEMILELMKSEEGRLSEILERVGLERLRAIS